MSGLENELLITAGAAGAIIFVNAGATYAGAATIFFTTTGAGGGGA
jgi:hypothetical protein